MIKVQSRVFAKVLLLMSKSRRKTPSLVGNAARQAASATSMANNSSVRAQNNSR